MNGCHHMPYLVTSCCRATAMDSGGKEARMSSCMQGSKQAITFLRGTPSLLASTLCRPMNTSAAVMRACPAPHSITPLQQSHIIDVKADDIHRQICKPVATSAAVMRACPAQQNICNCRLCEEVSSCHEGWPCNTRRYFIAKETIHDTRGW